MKQALCITLSKIEFQCVFTLMFIGNQENEFDLLLPKAGMQVLTLFVFYPRLTTLHRKGHIWLFFKHFPPLNIPIRKFTYYYCYPHFFLRWQNRYYDLLWSGLAACVHHDDNSPNRLTVNPGCHNILSKQLGKMGIFVKGTVYFACKKSQNCLLRAHFW